MSDRQTLDVYNARVADYAKFADVSLPGAAIKRFIEALPPASRVLDLGCGPGVSSVHLRAAGHLPDPTDASEEMVKMAQEVHDLPARLATFDEIEGTALYEGIWANFSLLHAPRVAMPGHLMALSQALKPGGLFHIGMKTGTGEKRDPIGRRYAYYTAQELTQMLRDVQITVTWELAGAEPGLDGVTAPYILLQGHKDD